jgi:hypothetical protein
VQPPSNGSIFDGRQTAVAELGPGSPHHHAPSIKLSSSAVDAARRLARPLPTAKLCGHQQRLLSAGGGEESGTPFRINMSVNSFNSTRPRQFIAGRSITKPIKREDVDCYVDESRRSGTKRMDTFQTPWDPFVVAQESQRVEFTTIVSSTHRGGRRPLHSVPSKKDDCATTVSRVWPLVNYTTAGLCLKFCR